MTSPNPKAVEAAGEMQAAGERAMLECTRAGFGPDVTVGKIIEAVRPLIETSVRGETVNAEGLNPVHHAGSNPVAPPTPRSPGDVGEIRERHERDEKARINGWEGFHDMDRVAARHTDRATLLAHITRLSAALAERDAAKQELVSLFCNEEMALGNEGDIAGWQTEHAAVVAIRRLRASLAEAEATNALLRNDYEVEQRKRLFLQWKLVEIRAEAIKDPKDRAAEIAKAKDALKTLGNPVLEREVENAAKRAVVQHEIIAGYQSTIATLTAQVEGIREECAKIAMRWAETVAIILEGSDREMTPDELRAAKLAGYEIAEQIRSARQPETGGKE